MLKIKDKMHNSSKGDFLTREIFEASVAIDGRFLDWDQEDRNNFVKSLVKNTQKFILNEGIVLPIKDGHNDPTQETKGYITDLFLKTKKSEEGETIVCVGAKLFLYEPYYSYYTDGRYPGISVEIAEEGYTSSGKQFGAHLTAAALCGIDMAAYPLLSYELSRGGNLNWFQFIGTKKYFTKEYKMTKDEVKGTLESCYEIIDSLEDSDQKTKLQAALKSVYDSLDELEDKASDKTEEAARMTSDEEEVKVAVEDEEMKKEYARLKADKIELAYEKLAFSGKIGKDQKLNFTKIAESTGLDTAISIYSALETKRPLEGTKIASPAKGDVSTEKSEIVDRYFKNTKVGKVLKETYSGTKK